MNASLKNVAGTLALLLSIASSACTADLTEIVVVVDSDMLAPSELDRVVIEVEGMGAQDPVDTNLRTHAFPLSLGLVHDGGALGPIRVIATGMRGTNEVVVAERSEISFQRGKTRMLRLTLRRVCTTTPNLCKGSCADGSCLSDWNPDLGKVDASTPGDAGTDADAADEDSGDDDSGIDDAGTDADLGDAGDAGVDAGPPCVLEGGECFDYTPSNFDPVSAAEMAERNGALLIDCATAELDTTDSTFTGWCRGVPEVLTITQAGGGQAVLLPVTSLTITSGGRLRLFGDKPAIVAVYGNATINGAIDASAAGGVPGAGGNASCAGGIGPSGVSQPGNDDGAHGGSGGSFGTLGARGGRGNRFEGLGMLTAAGTLEGDVLNVPLRGGCPGGRGGLGSATDGGNLGGAGGGAVQVSAAGTLTVGGVLTAGGGGGIGGQRQEDGGGGGGSGGAILLEGGSVDITMGAWISTNGGGGGGGGDYDSAPAQPGIDAAPGSDLGGAGGAGDNRGGAGGRGAGAGAAAGNGADGQTGGFPPLINGAGGGGAGGGMGRIRVHDEMRASNECAFVGNFSPAATITCGR